MLESIDAKSPAAGARVVARAWTDDGYKARLLEDVNKAAAALGIDAGGIPIRAVENTESVHNVIVCTLCPCYPRMLIALPPDCHPPPAHPSRTVPAPPTLPAQFAPGNPAARSQPGH